jgi:hypothetical protein
MYTRARKTVIAALFSVALFPCVAFASSTLSLSPASGSYPVDDIIPVRVLVQSPEKLAAVEATLEFDAKLVSVDIISTSQDVSWVVTPTVDGGVLRYSGMVKKDAPTTLELMTLNVHALRPGKPELRFTSGASTVAADGSGGNTLGHITQASFDIAPKEGFAPGAKSADVGEVLGAADAKTLTVTAKEIPDESAWYPLHDVTMSWTLPHEVKDVRIGLSRKAEDTGYKSVSSGTTTRLVTDLEEGEWYFHLTPEGGALKDSVHFRLAVDHSAPVLGTTTEVVRDDSHDPNLAYAVNATDTVSGVAYYEFTVDNGTAERWIDDGTGIYHFRSTVFGDHDLTIAAVDKAGNRSESKVRFTVTALDKPSVRVEKEKFAEASPIIAQIKGVAGATARVVFEGGSVHHEDTVQLDNTGSGTYTLKESILPGNYMLSVVQTLGNGASSYEPVRVDVEITASIIGYLGRNPALSIALLPILLIALVIGGWRLGKSFLAYQLRGQKGNTPQLALPAPRSEREVQRSNTVRPVQTAPLELRKVIRVQAPGAVIDLRRRE